MIACLGCVDGAIRQQIVRINYKFASERRFIGLRDNARPDIVPKAKQVLAVRRRTDRYCDHSMGSGRPSDGVDQLKASKRLAEIGRAARRECLAPSVRRIQSRHEDDGRATAPGGQFSSRFDPGHAAQMYV
jgi:hypothetical protein